MKLASPLIIIGSLTTVATIVVGIVAPGPWVGAVPAIGTALAACFTDSPATVAAKVDEALNTPVPDA